MKDEVSEEEVKRLYEFRKAGKCDRCEKMKPTFLYSRKDWRWLCLDCLLQEIREHLARSVDIT